MLEEQEIIDLRSRAESAFSKTERTNAQQLWQDIIDYIMPNQFTNFSTQSLTTSRGQKTTQQVFDSTAIQANYDLASAVNSTMTSPTSVWSKIRHREDQYNENMEVNIWFDSINKIAHKYFMDSNLYQQLHKAYQSLTSLGNMALLHEQKKDQFGRFTGFQFTAIHLAQLAWQENSEGIVDTIFRRFPMTSKQIRDKFPEAPMDDLEESDEVDPNREYSVLHCIYPRDPKEVKYDSLGLAPPENRPFASYYILMDSGLILDEDGYYELPIYVARWSTCCGEEYGRGPGIIALPDVISLNTLRMQHFQSTALAIAPPMLTTARNIVNNAVDIRPRGITVVRDLNGTKEWITGARMDVAQVDEAQLRESIQKVFLLDKLMLPPRTDTGEMTAYEVSQRIEQMQRVLGPTLTRLNNELLNPMMIRSVRILLREGVLPPVPEQLQNSDLDVDILFVNQLARAQDNEIVSGMLRWLNHLGMMSQMDPGVLDLVNFDKMAIEAGKVEGIDETLIRDNREVAAIRKQRAQQQQMQMQAELQLKQADAASKSGGVQPPDGGM